MQTHQASYLASRNCISCMQQQGSQGHHYHPLLLGWCDQLLLHPCHTNSTRVHLCWVCVSVASSIECCCSYAVSASSSVMTSLAMESPCITHWSIAMLDVFDSGIYLPVSIEVSVMLRTHLTKTVMRAIDGVYIPSWLFMNDFAKALKLLKVH